MCETSLIFDCSIPYWAYPHLQYSSGSRGCLTLICKFCSFLQSSQPVHCSAVVRLLLLLWVVGAPASVPANEAKRQNVCQQFWLLLLLPPATVPLLLHLALFFCAFSLPPFRRSAIPPFRHSAIPPFPNATRQEMQCKQWLCNCVSLCMYCHSSYHCYALWFTTLLRTNGRKKQTRTRTNETAELCVHSFMFHDKHFAFLIFALFKLIWVVRSICTLSLFSQGHVYFTHTHTYAHTPHWDVYTTAKWEYDFGWIDIQLLEKTDINTMSTDWVGSFL